MAEAGKEIFDIRHEQFDVFEHISGKTGAFVKALSFKDRVCRLISLQNPR